MKQLNIGLIGVGAGVVQCLQDNADLIASRAGFLPVITRIADLDITTDRGVAVRPGVLTTQAQDILVDPDISIVIELVGGLTIARKFILAALNAGKSVVTANKALLALHGDEIFDAAAKKGVIVAFEA